MRADMAYPHTVVHLGLMRSIRERLGTVGSTLHLRRNPIQRNRLSIAILAAIWVLWVFPVLAAAPVPFRNIPNQGGAPCKPDLSTPCTPETDAHRKPGQPRKPSPPKLAITTPQMGAAVSGPATQVHVQVPERFDVNSLRLYLNGRDVSARVFPAPCTQTACNADARLVPADGLRQGENRLVATAHGKLVHAHGPSRGTGPHAVARVRFTYSELLGDVPVKYLPSVVGLTASAGGTQPWVTIKTGTPASLVDPSDQTQFSLPYSDTTLPAETVTACTTTYQVLVLDRALPVSQRSYACYGDSESLTAYLATLDATSLVVVGTTPGAVAASGLNTASIGGTDYGSTPASTYPQTYVAIGVPGAAANSAYEVYDTASDVPLLQRSATALGVLSRDVSGNYLFLPTQAYQFEVYPNNPATPGQSDVYLATQNGGQGPAVFGFNSQANVSGGFWVLVLDRVTLQPVDTDGAGYCTPIFYCGTVYETGNPDDGIRASAVAALTAALNNVTERQLAFIVSSGQPFQSAADVTTDLANAFAYFGGSHYTLPKLLSPTATYVLIGSGRGDNFRSPFTPGVVNASSAFVPQGQTGIVRGVLERDHLGLYRPTVASQEDGQGNGPEAVSVSVDYSFHQIASYDPLDWPLTDTTGHITAYHVASQEFLQAISLATGSHDQDVRWYYAGSPSTLGQHNIYFLDGPVVSNTYNVCLQTWTVPPNAGYTLQDWCDVRLQLFNEITYLNDSNAFLGEDGLQGLVDGTGSASGTSIAGDMIEATYQALNGQLQAGTTSTHVNVKVADWMNLVSALAAIPAAIAGPADLPLVGAGLGVISGALKTGAAVETLRPNDPTPLQYTNGFDVTLGELQNDYQNNQTTLIASYGQALDAIYTDWGKLQAAGQLAADSGSGWHFSDQLSHVALSQQFQAGVNRSLYLQLLSQIYWLDTYPNVPVPTPATLGMMNIYTSGGAYLYSCLAVYPSSLPSLGYAAYPTFSGGTGTDIFVIGGEIANQGTDSVTESLPTTALLEFLFSAPDPNNPTTPSPLNLPTDFIYAAEKGLGGVLDTRAGPNQGNGLCYKPGCSAYNSGTSCIGP